MSAASVGVAKFEVEVVGDEILKDPSRHCLQRCTRKAWTSESMFPWIRAVTHDFVLLNTSRGGTTPIFNEIGRSVWRDTRVEVVEVMSIEHLRFPPEPSTVRRIWAPKR